MGGVRYLLIFLLAAIAFLPAGAVPDIVSPSLNKNVYSSGEIGEVLFTLRTSENEVIFLAIKSNDVVNTRKVIEVNGNQNFNLPFQAPEDSGLFSVNIEIADADGMVNIATINGIVEPKSYDLIINLEPDKTITSIGQSLDFTLSLANIGSEPNKVEIKFSDLGTTRIPNTVYDLDSEENIDIPITLYLPSDLYGNQEYTVTACSVISRECVETTSLVNIYQDTNDLTSFSVLPESITTMVYIEEKYVFDVTNNAPYIQTYTLSVHSPSDWRGDVSFDEFSFELQPGENRKYGLEIVSEDVGTFEYVYILTSSSADKSGIVTLVVNQPSITGMAITSVGGRSWIFGLVAFVVIAGLLYLLTKSQKLPYAMSDKLPQIPPV